MILSLFIFFFSFISFMLGVAFFTILERKVLGLVGHRLGPFKVSFLGIFQFLADALKLMNKEINSLSNFSSFFYYFSSFLMILCSLIIFFCSPSLSWILSFKLSFLIILMALSLNSFNSILSGWSTFSKFALLGSIRTVSQLISYEILLYLCFFFFFFMVFSFDLFQLFFFQMDFLFFFFPFLFLGWIFSVLMELNRSPYDFSEGESELVSGFNVDFGCSSFTLLFLAEYGFIFFFMYITFFLFFFYFPIFSSSFFFFVIWVRSCFPRFRFDKLMSLCWKIHVPQFSFLLCLFFFVYF